MMTIIAAAVICGIIGIGAGYFYRMKIAEGKLGQAEVEARRIISSAQQNAESKKKELVLEGKRKFINYVWMLKRKIRNGGQNYSVWNDAYCRRKSISIKSLIL